MNWTPWTSSAATAALAVGTALAPISARATIYVSVEQAQHDIFGKLALTPHPVLLTSQQQDRLKEVSSVSLAFQGNRIWKVADGGWFIVDEVVGKHEMITYAVGLNADGSVRRVEVLEYRESYGYEVAQAQWLQQFEGATSSAPLKLGKDVKNISGATLSSKHLTDGVKRVVELYTMVLQHA